MRGFRYKNGDRPLDGYTIQRGAGRGGFGEVYYALSDAGREVALKVIFGYEQIELRGVSQCMNLKSPHLVTIFDVKHNDEAIPFVIMEYVNGPSLRQLLDESPGGLGTQKSAFFLREMARGLSYLHNCGIVHRDLKPGNIFYENGYVKIGDYGLSKAMTASMHSGQTITVGTVHYMAPEIGMGKYDQSIDIYALGAVLFEMITGQPPYLGSSPSEILMKHMSAEPDVSRIEEPFATVIRKCMAKDPSQRYQNAQEVVEAVFGSEQVRQSVSSFSPESLSVVAQRVANRVAVGGGSRTPTPGGVAVEDRPADVWERMGRMIGKAENRLSEMGDRVAAVGGKLIPANARRGLDPRGFAAHDAAAEKCDPMSLRQRQALALVVLVLLAIAIGVASPYRSDGIFPALWQALFGTAGGVCGLLISRKKLMPQVRRESKTIRRLAMGGPAALLVLVTCLPVVGMVNGRAQESVGTTLIALAVPIFFLDWASRMSPTRRERLSFSFAIGAGLFGMIISMFVRGNWGVAIGVLAGLSLVIQILCPWDPASALIQAANGSGAREDSGWSWAGPAAAATTAETLRARPGDVPPVPGAGEMPGNPVPPPIPAISTMAAAPAARRRVVRPFARVFWLVLMTLALSAGVMLVVAANMENRGNFYNQEQCAMIGFGIGLMLMAAASLALSFQKTFTGWWSYLFRPLLMWACVQSILVSAILLGNARMSSDEMLIAVFCIVFPSVLLMILFFGWIIGHRPAASGARAASGAWARPVVEDGGPRFSGPAPTPAASGVHAMSASSLPLHPQRDWHVGHALVGFLGMALLLVGAMIGLLLVMDLPGLVAAGVPDPALPQQITRDFGGFDRWPRLFTLIGHVILWVAMFLSAGLLMLSRRWAGSAHILRGLAAVAVVGICIALLHSAVRTDWPSALANQNGEARVPRALDNFVSAMEPGLVRAAAFTAGAGLLLLLWPASTRTRQRASTPRPAPPLRETVGASE